MVIATMATIIATIAIMITAIENNYCNVAF